MNAIASSHPIDRARLLELGILAEVEHHAELDSTQGRAHRLADQGARGPVLVVAERQTAGRGRGSNSWWTGEGSLAFSLLFDPVAWDLPAQTAPVRSLAAGVAVVAAVSPLVSPHHVGLHWPNDVFVVDRKLAGILIDVLADGRHVLGIGLNVNNSFAAAPAEVSARGVSICELTGTSHDRTSLVAAILNELISVLRQSATDLAAFGERFQSLCLQVGRPLVIDSAGRRLRGECLGIAPDGALLLQTESRLERIYSGVLEHASR